MILKGTLESDNELKATYIDANANLVLEDKVETSGLGGIYPKGILIGTLKEVNDTSNITGRYAIIETAVDFSKLESVLVITEKWLEIVSDKLLLKIVPKGTGHIDNF